MKMIDEVFLFNFSDDFKYECSQCGEKFLYKEQLNIHQNRHNNVFHKCTECGKRFLIKSNLTKHIQSHSGNRLKQADSNVHVCLLIPL